MKLLKIPTILGLIGSILILAGGFSHTMAVIGAGGVLLMICFIMWLIGKK